MVCFKVEGGEIEVRLLRLSATGKELGYLDEHCPVGESDAPKEQEQRRYVLAENTFSGVEVRLKKGFVHGKYSGRFLVHVFTLSGRTPFAGFNVTENFRLAYKRKPQTEDRVSRIKTGNGNIDGNDIEGAKIEFHAITPGRSQRQTPYICF